MLGSTTPKRSISSLSTVPTMVNQPSSTPTTITSANNSGNTHSNSNNNNNNSNNNSNYGISAAMAEAGVSADVIDSMVRYGNKMVDQFHDRERASASHREFSDTLYTVNAGQTAYLRPGFVLDDLLTDDEHPNIKSSYNAFARLRTQEHAVDSILEKTRGVQHNAYLDYSELFMSLKSAPAKTLKVIIKSRIMSQNPGYPFKMALSIEAQLFSSFASEFSGSSSLAPQTPAFVRRLDLSRVFRRILVASENEIVEWTNSAHKGGRVNAFVFQTELNNEQNIKLLLELNQTPRVYKLNNQLAQLAHGPTATLQSVISLLWDYGTEYKLFEFNPVSATLTLTCDEYLSTVFNYPVGEKVAWKGIERHILPTLTEQPPLMITIPVMFSVPENVVSFVVPLMYDNHNELIGNGRNNNSTKSKNKSKNINENGCYDLGNGNNSIDNNNNGNNSNNNENNNNNSFINCANGCNDMECCDVDDDDEFNEMNECYGTDDGRLKTNGSGSNDDGLSSSSASSKIETVADASRYFKSRKISPFDTSEDSSVASAQIKELDDRLDQIFTEIRERIARRKMYLEFARKPSAAAAKVTAALLRDRGIVAAKISGQNPDEIRKSSFYKSHSPYMSHTVKAYFTVPMEKRRHKN